MEWRTWNRCVYCITLSNSLRKWMNVSIYYDHYVTSQLDINWKNDVWCLTWKRHYFSIWYWVLSKACLKEWSFPLCRLPKSWSLWKGLDQFKPDFHTLITYLTGLWHSSTCLSLSLWWYRYTYIYIPVLYISTS